jgi:hypothetical protein
MLEIRYRRRFLKTDWSEAFSGLAGGSRCPGVADGRHREGRAAVAEIGLRETIDALRAELTAARAEAADAEVQFPVAGVQLEFHVGVTRSAEGKGGVKFWVLELGGGGSYARETIQKVVVTLGPPVDRAGVPVKVADPSTVRP